MNISPTLQKLIEQIHALSFLTEEQRISFVANLEHIDPTYYTQLGGALWKANTKYLEEKEKLDSALAASTNTIVQEIDADIKDAQKRIETASEASDEEGSEELLHTM